MEKPQVFADNPPIIEPTSSPKAGAEASEELRIIGVGAVSVAVIDSAIELAYEHKRTVMIIASRGQVDSTEFGGGYLESWNQRDLVRYVRDKDPDNRVLVCRDHGGPFQGPGEAGLPEGVAMDRARRSLREDISSGFDLVHIDATLQNAKFVGWDTANERTLDLYETCWRDTEAADRNIGVEVGMERHDSSATTSDVFEQELSKLLRGLEQRQLPVPTFVSPSLGTLVVEDKNIGNIVPTYSRGEILHHVERIAKICEREGVGLKAHNMDYLDTDVVEALVGARVSSFNIAPEFGVAQTRSILEELNTHGLTQEADKLLELAFASRKWEKWVRSDSDLTLEEKSELAGHYIFSSGECKQILTKTSAYIAGRGADLDATSRADITAAMMRFALPIWNVTSS